MVESFLKQASIWALNAPFVACTTPCLVSKFKIRKWMRAQVADFAWTGRLFYYSDDPVISFLFIFFSVLEWKLCSHLWDLATPFEAKYPTLVPGVLARVLTYIEAAWTVGSIAEGLSQHSALAKACAHVDVARWKIASDQILFSTEHTDLIKLKYITVDLGCPTVEQLWLKGAWSNNANVSITAHSQRQGCHGSLDRYSSTCVETRNFWKYKMGVLTAIISHYSKKGKNFRNKKKKI